MEIVPGEYLQTWPLVSFLLSEKGESFPRSIPIGGYVSDSRKLFHNIPVEKRKWTPQTTSPTPVSSYLYFDKILTAMYSS